MNLNSSHSDLFRKLNSRTSHYLMDQLSQNLLKIDQDIQSSILGFLLLYIANHDKTHEDPFHVTEHNQTQC